MKVKVNPEAIDDIVKIKKYIREEFCNPAAAERIVNKITAKYKLLKTSPYIGARLKAVDEMEIEYRYLVCGNYIIIYNVLSDHVEVARVVYGKRDYAKIIFGCDETETDPETDFQEDTE